MANSKKDKKDKAYSLYLSTNLSLADISEAVGVVYKTVQQWAQKDNWKAQKAAHSLTREKLIMNQLVQINNLQEAIFARENKFPDAKEQDIILKAAKVVRDLRTKTSLPDYFNVVHELLRALASIDLELTQKLAPMARAFLIDKTRSVDE